MTSSFYIVIPIILTLILSFIITEFVERLINPILSRKVLNNSNTKNFEFKS